MDDQRFFRIFKEVYCWYMQTEGRDTEKQKQQMEEINNVYRELVTLNLWEDISLIKNKKLGTEKNKVVRVCPPTF